MLPRQWTCDSEVSSLAADATGYLFVGIYTTRNVPRSGGTHERRRTKYPRLCEDVAVYSPTANGKADSRATHTFPEAVTGLHGPGGRRIG